MLKKRQNGKAKSSTKKNKGGQVLTYNSKNFYWLNRKLDLERTMYGLVKPFRKKSDPKKRKNSKNQSQIAGGVHRGGGALGGGNSGADNSGVVNL